MLNQIKSVLVTGGAGFVGSLLCQKLLDRGYHVHCLDNFHCSDANSFPYVSHPNFVFEKFDCSNYYLSKNFNYDGIIHLAGLVGFPACSASRTASKLMNYDTTKMITELADNANCKLIFSSTQSVYGKVEGLCTEETPENPNSIYGEHKLLAEKIVTSYDKSIALRFATGFGVSYKQRFDTLPNNMTYDAVKNKVLNIYQKDVKRAFISVNEMANLLIYCLENFDNRNYSVYNAGSESLNMTKQELVDKIYKYVQFETFYMNGKDPEQRDYPVSYKRLSEFGYNVKNDMDQQIENLVKLWRLYV